MHLRPFARVALLPALVAFVFAACDSDTSNATAYPDPSLLVGTWRAVNTDGESGYAINDTATVVFAPDGRFASFVDIHSTWIAGNSTRVEHDTCLGHWSASGDSLSVSIATVRPDTAEIEAGTTTHGWMVTSELLRLTRRMRNGSVLQSELKRLSNDYDRLSNLDIP